MDEINNLLLKIYDASQNTSISEFPQIVFPLLKEEVKFDTGGFCDFSSINTTEIKLVSAYAFNVCPHEKLSVRNNYIEPETLTGKKDLASEDPSLAMAFQNKNTAISLSINRTKLKSNLVSYAKKTDSYHTIVMATIPPGPNRFQTLALWRGKNNIEYIKDDLTKANIVLPHVFRAFAINRQIHKNSEIKNPDRGLAICSMKGLLIFNDEIAANFIANEFQTWNPPFLPPILFKKLISLSEKIYIGKLFVLTVRHSKGLLFLDLKKTITFENLSPTELVIAEMLTLNASYKVIAQKLGNQPATVRNQAHNIYLKFGISGKAELAKIFHITR